MNNTASIGDYVLGMRSMPVPQLNATPAPAVSAPNIKPVHIEKQLSTGNLNNAAKIDQQAKMQMPELKAAVNSMQAMKPDNNKPNVAPQVAVAPRAEPGLNEGYLGSVMNDDNKNRNRKNHDDDLKAGMAYGNSPSPAEFQTPTIVPNLAGSQGAANEDAYDSADQLIGLLDTTSQSFKGIKGQALDDEAAKSLNVTIKMTNDAMTSVNMVMRDGPTHESVKDDLEAQEMFVKQGFVPNPTFAATMPG